MKQMSDEEFDAFYARAMKSGTIDTGEDAGETDDPIAQMSDKEFDAFYARAMLEGTIDAD